MKRVVIITGREKSGKTTVSLGIGLNLKSIAYLRVGKNKDDSLIVKDILKINNLNFGNNELPKAIENLKEENVLLEVDLISGYSQGESAIQIAKNNKIPLVFVCDFENEDYLDFYKDLFRNYGIEFKGFIYNKVKNQSKDALGFIPFCNILSAISVNQVIEELDAAVVAGFGGKSRLIEKVLVGAMTLEHAIRYFKQPGSKAIITGGDREDLILAALSSQTACLILTGDICPSKQVMIEAEKRDIAVLVVSYDTFTTANKVKDLIARISPKDDEKIKKITQLVGGWLNLDKIFA